MRARPPADRLLYLISPNYTTHLLRYVRSLRARTVTHPPHHTLTCPSVHLYSSSLTNNPAPRQNNDSLAALSQKVSQLRSVTVDIYDNARDQGVIDSTSETFSNMTTSLKGSARRLGTMASQGNKVAIFKLAGMLVGVVVVMYWLLSWIF